MATEKKAVKSIYEQLIAAFKTMPVDLPQDGRNEHFSYNYTSIDTVKRNVSAILKQSGLGLAFNVEEIRTTPLGTDPETGAPLKLHLFIKVAATFYNAQGETFTINTYGEGVDSTDKALSKAKSDAFKRLFSDSFIIAAGDVDSNATNTDGSSKVHVKKANANRPRSDKQAAAIKKMCGVLGTTPELMGVNDLDKLTMSDASKLIEQLSNQIAEKKAASEQLHATHNPNPGKEPEGFGF